MRASTSKILFAALTFTLSTSLMGQQAPTLNFRLPPLNIPPSLLLNPCNDNHVSSVELNPLDDETYQILIHFDGVSIDADKTSLSCTLYSKLPAELAATGSKFRLISSKYQLNANMPVKAQAIAAFGVGMVPRGDRRFTSENQLVMGKSETMNRLTAEVSNSAQTGGEQTPDFSKILGSDALIRAIKPATMSRLLMPKAANIPVAAKTVMAPSKNKFVFYKPALKADLIKALFPRIPLILNSIIVIIDGAKNRSSDADPTIGLEIPDSEKDAVIVSDQYIANQFELGFTSDEKNTGNAAVSVDWIEIVVKVQN